MSGLRQGGLHLGAGTVVSRILGFIRAALLAAVVGTIGSRAADAFAVANQLPNNVFWLISSGVFSAVLVPQIVRSSRHDDGGAAYINKVITLGLVFLAGVTAVALAASPWLVSIYTRDWPAAQLQLAVAFALWCLPQILFYGVFSLFGETLNARGQFAPAAWAPLANNLVALGGLGVFAIAFGVYPGATGSVLIWSPAMVALLAGTTTLGVVAQSVVVVIALRRAGIKFRLDFRWREVSLGSVSRVATWTLGLVIIGQLLGIVQSQVAGLATGRGPSVFAVSTAWLLFMLPYSVIAVSIGTVYFTRFSEHSANGDLRSLAADAGSTARLLVVTMIGATFAMIVIALPISRFFTDTADAAAAFALLLIAYLVALVPFALLFLFQRVFYALNDARTPFLYTCVQAIVLLAGTLLLPSLVSVAFLAAGVALVQSIATTFQMVLAAILLRRKIGPFGGRATLTATGRSIVAAAIAGAVCVPPLWLLVGTGLDGWAMADRAQGLAVAAGGAVLFAAIYAATMLTLRDPTARGMYRALRRSE